MTASGASPAERAGRAAKTSRRRRRERERAFGWAAVTLVAIPLLFAAVWTRTEVGEELRRRDELFAARDSLEHWVAQLSCERSRLTVWDAVERRLHGTGLRPPSGDEVVWVAVDPMRRKGGV